MDHSQSGEDGFLSIFWVRFAFVLPGKGGCFPSVQVGCLTEGKRAERADLRSKAAGSRCELSGDSECRLAGWLATGHGMQLLLRVIRLTQKSDGCPWRLYERPGGLNMREELHCQCPCDACLIACFKIGQDRESVSKLASVFEFSSLGIRLPVSCGFSSTSRE